MQSSDFHKTRFKSGKHTQRACGTDGRLRASTESELEWPDEESDDSDDDEFGDEPDEYFRRFFAFFFTAERFALFPVLTLGAGRTSIGTSISLSLSLPDEALTSCAKK
ncbi:unnamed protein product [Gongylonema pulchrum]|uniref:Uncharacterized protein n=1 Tax=Gongylonema pulchrum TaxID=637853 RepID=A0A183DLJ3_9BILA|nr:unnamed protein product [Gongylonema pulchrum]